MTDKKNIIATLADLDKLSNTNIQCFHFPGYTNEGVRFNIKVKSFCLLYLNGKFTKMFTNKDADTDGYIDINYTPWSEPPFEYVITDVLILGDLYALNIGGLDYFLGCGNREYIYDYDTFLNLEELSMQAPYSSINRLKIPDLSKFTKLKVLSLGQFEMLNDYDDYTILDLSVLKNLSEFSAWQCCAKEFMFNGLDNLKSIKLNEVYGSITITDLQNLEYVGINAGSLKTDGYVRLRNLPNLKTLNICDNHEYQYNVINDVFPENSPNLRSINIYNSIIYLPYNLNERYPNLREINLKSTEYSSVNDITGLWQNLIKSLPDCNLNDKGILRLEKSTLAPKVREALANAGKYWDVE